MEPLILKALAQVLHALSIIIRILVRREAGYVTFDLTTEAQNFAYYLDNELAPQLERGSEPRNVSRFLIRRTGSDKEESQP